MLTFLINITIKIIPEIVVCVFLCIIVPQSIEAANLFQQDSSVVVKDVPVKNNNNIKIKSPKTAMIYSAVFPGLGQLYNGKKLKAVIFFGGEFGLLANSIYLNQQYKKSIFEYDKEFYLNNRNLSTWYLVGAVLFSVIDAFVDAHLYNFDESPDLSLNMTPFGEDSGLMLTV